MNTLTYIHLGTLVFIFAPFFSEKFILSDKADKKNKLWKRILFHFILTIILYHVLVDSFSFSNHYGEIVVSLLCGLFLPHLLERGLEKISTLCGKAFKIGPTTEEKISYIVILVGIFIHVFFDSMVMQGSDYLGDHMGHLHQHGHEHHHHHHHSTKSLIVIHRFSMAMYLWTLIARLKDHFWGKVSFYLPFILLPYVSFYCFDPSDWPLLRHSVYVFQGFFVGSLIGHFGSSLKKTYHMIAK